MTWLPSQRRCCFGCSAILCAALCVALPGVVAQQFQTTASTPRPPEAALDALARKWEPALFEERGTAPWEPGLTPCVTTAAGRRCAPGALLLGGWQTGSKHLASILSAAYPNALKSLPGQACWGQWKDDEGGRRWLSEKWVAALDDPKTTLAAALSCHATLQFYPDSAHRFHKFWSEYYWPCKKKCMDDRACARTYYEKEMWTCKAAALQTHDDLVNLPTEPLGAPFNFTTPWLVRQFYGPATPPRLLAMVRSPIDRLVHAYYGHPHYAKKYGVGAAKFGGYVAEQLDGWRKCAATFGLRRCAIHFEQLGPQPASVFFHADQIIRGMYAPFIEDWLAAMPGALLVVRAEDLLGGDAPRREVLRKAARHLGLPAAGLDAAALAAKEATLKPYAELGKKGLGSSRFAGAAISLKDRSPPEASEPLLPETRADLCATYAPLNRQLRDLLAAERTSCEGAACDGFLWPGDCAA